MAATPPLVCSLSPEALAARREGLLAELARRAAHREALPNGVRLTLPPAPDALATIIRVVDAERQCCRFLRFEISVAPEEGPITLELSGPPGTPAFLDALFTA
jgi:hypothetical protein